MNEFQLDMKCEKQKKDVNRWWRELGKISAERAASSRSSATLSCIDSQPETLVNSNLQILRTCIIIAANTILILKIDIRHIMYDQRVSGLKTIHFVGKLIPRIAVFFDFFLLIYKK